MECEKCEGRGGYATDLEGSEVEDCVSCNAGARRCDGCSNDATHVVTTNYKSKFGAWKAIQDYFCDECDPRAFTKSTVRDE